MKDGYVARTKMRGFVALLIQTSIAAPGQGHSIAPSKTLNIERPPTVHGLHSSGCCSGRATVNVIPLDRFLSTEIVPPCCDTI